MAKFKQQRHVPNIHPDQNRSGVDGKTNQGWVRPDERDTTMGTSNTEFPTMHSNESAGYAKVESVGCVLCGIPFTREVGDPTDVCPFDWNWKLRLDEFLPKEDVTEEDIKRLKNAASGQEFAKIKSEILIRIRNEKRQRNQERWKAQQKAKEHGNEGTVGNSNGEQV